MMSDAIGYIATLAVFIAADLAWLSVTTSRIYRPTLGNVLLSGVNLPPAVVFYALYPIGILIFAVSPATKNGSVMTAVVYGALFGFFTYSTYDLTNYATLRNWSLQLTLVDIAWGSVLVTAAATAGFVVATKVAGPG
jgi:uncharacterized membrane protein